MLKTLQMASNNNSVNYPWNRMLLVICLFVSQLHFGSVNCTTQLSCSNKPHEKKHFILVHGLGQGAWCWSKLIPLLEVCGHNVTAMDLSASGINPKQIQDLRSFNDYSAPLLELMNSLPANEKAILVGHSLGGMNLALAMDRYPKKISVAVFVSAFLPDTVHRPSYVLEKYLQQENIVEILLDSLFYNVTRPNQTPLGVLLFGPNALKYNVFNLSSPEDLELERWLLRPGSMFLDDLSTIKSLSDKRFGSVKKVYIKHQEDRVLSIKFQSWMIDNARMREVKEIKNVDHVSMVTRPRELLELLLDVAHEYN